jgi:hypothetical protein
MAVGICFHWTWTLLFLLWEVGILYHVAIARHGRREVGYVLEERMRFAGLKNDTGVGRLACF